MQHLGPQAVDHEHQRQGPPAAAHHYLVAQLLPLGRLALEVQREHAPRVVPQREDVLVTGTVGVG